MLKNTSLIQEDNNLCEIGKNDVTFKKIELKYKLIFACVFLFFAFWLWLMLKPYPGLGPFINKANRVDSILIYRSERITTIKDLQKINKIIEELKNCTPITPEKIKLGFAFIDMRFFFHGKNDSEDIRIMS